MVSGKEISFVTGKNVSLVGFGKLDKAEIKIINKIMATYIRKVEEKIDYEELKIRLKMHQHTNSYMHELEADMVLHPGVQLNAKITHKNIYRALAMIMTKLLNEINHLKKKSLTKKSNKEI